MTVSEAIWAVDCARKGNKFSEKEKIMWLSQLDGIIKSETVDTHRGAESVSFSGYDSDTDPDTVLLVPEPYNDVYIHWLVSKIDLYNGETDRYNNDVYLYNDAKRQFVDWYNRTHLPSGGKRMRW